MNEDKSRQRLGRGLASLIGAGAVSPARAANGFAPPSPFEGGERRVELSLIAPNPRNPRRRFDEAELADLATSVRTHGVVQPILVRPKATASTEFEIVAGERRWRAAKAAGLSDVPVVVRDISDRESLEIAIIENVQRADLSAIEEAQAYEMLIEEHGYTQADLADVLGKSRSHVANTLRLLKLPESVRDMLTRGEISPGHARTAVSADNPEAFARQIVEGGLTVREAEDLARGGGVTPQPAQPRAPDSNAQRDRPGRTRLPAAGREGGAADRPIAAKDDDTRALEALLSEALGMPVDIALAGEGGDLRITYANLEQLDEICRLLQAGHFNRGGGPRIRSL